MEEIDPPHSQDPDDSFEGDPLAPELRALGADLKAALLVLPDPAVMEAHLAAMCEASAASIPAPAPLVPLSGSRAPWARRSVAAGGVAVAMLAGTAGLAAAGSLPAPVQDRVADLVSPLGLTFPHHDGRPDELRVTTNDPPSELPTTPAPAARPSTVVPTTTPSVPETTAVPVPTTTKPTEAPGQTGANPGQTGAEPPGQSGANPGQLGEPGQPGNGGPSTAPGQVDPDKDAKDKEAKDKAEREKAEQEKAAKEKAAQDAAAQEEADRQRREAEARRQAEEDRKAQAGAGGKPGS